MEYLFCLYFSTILQALVTVPLAWFGFIRHFIFSNVIDLTALKLLDENKT